MKPIFFLLVVPALFAGVGSSARAQGAAEKREGRTAGTGKVLILTNERAFEGDIEQAGELYRVHRGVGEIVIAANQVLRLCTDWDDAVRFMRSRANLDDPDERIRLAKWCQVNHQIERALAEAQAAFEMRPKHGETRQLVKVLQVTPTANSVKPSTESTPAPLPHMDLSFESVTAFSLKIQPILMNTCVQCHATSYRGAFRLYRLHEGGERVATQRNLAAVLKQISLDKPAASPLLVMAVCAHGDAKISPIPSRQSPAFLTLCGWIDQTLADNPHLRERAAAALAIRTANATPAPTRGQAVPPPLVMPTVPNTPPLVETASDEFSAALFNRAYHPERK